MCTLVQDGQCTYNIHLAQIADSFFDKFYQHLCLVRPVVCTGVIPPGFHRILGDLSCPWWSAGFAA